MMDINTEIPTKERRPIIPGSIIAPILAKAPPAPKNIKTFGGSMFFIKAVPIHLPVKNNTMAATL